MELKWTLNNDKKYVHLKYYGDPDFKTWARVMEEIFQHPDYKPGFGFVADLIESSAPDMDHLKAVKEFLISHQKEMLDSKWANITAQRAVHYGMTRVAQVFVEDLPVQLNAFNSEEEAIKWVCE